MDFFNYLHPMVVHFPITLLTLYCLMEITSFFQESGLLSKFVNIILIFGVTGLIAAALTGNQAAQKHEKSYVNGQSVTGEIIEIHETWATIAICFFTAGTFARIYLTIKKKLSRKIKLLYVIFSIIGFVIIFTASGYGAKLVYKYGVGTEIFQK